MEVFRVAYTTTGTELVEFGERSGYVPHDPDYSTGPDDSSFNFEEWIGSFPAPPDELAEAAGRLCYKSWNRPNPATATNPGYISNIIKQQHFSVLEHASATFYVSGVSRNLLVELERHRHLSFSVVSQRYVDHTNQDCVIPPAFNWLDISDREDLVAELKDVQNAAQVAYDYIYHFLLDKGFKTKQAREAARAVLPGATETEFLVTGNLRTWREVLQKRLSPTADAEIRALSELILVELKKYAPATFQDIESNY